MTRTKKRKLNNKKREERNFVDFSVVTEPALDLINVLADSLENGKDYIRDIRLMDLDIELKKKLLRELLLITKLKSKQVEELKVLLDSCKDENGEFLTRKDIRDQDDAATELVLLFARSSEKMMSLGVEVADTSVTTCKDLNKVFAEVIEVLSSDEGKQHLLDEFKMITAKYIGCTIEELDASMAELNEAVMKVQRDLLAGTARHMQQTRGEINGAK